MKLHEALREECICVGAELASKEAALAAAAAWAKKSPVLDGVDEVTILRGLEQREELGSTGFGRGIAIPHCRLEGVPDFVVGVLTVPGGVDFGAVDEKPVQVIVFIVAPEDASNRHLRLLSGISQALRGKNAVREILGCSNAEATRESLLRQALGELDIEGQAGKRMACVFVQDEKLFHEIIEVFAGMKEASTVVLSSENLHSHFARVPLFQGLWSDDAAGFSRLIVAMVDKRLSNELVRQVESRTGDLSQRSGVMITLQDVLYTAGSLDT